MAELYKHMDERGTPINTTPAINGKDLDLYRLYRIVTFLGGHSRYALHTQLSLFTSGSFFLTPATKKLKLKHETQAKNSTKKLNRREALSSL